MTKLVNKCEIHVSFYYSKSKNKSTAHGCWRLDFFVSDIKLQAIYKVIHTSNYDGHISKYVCKIGKYNQRGIIFSCNTILVHMKYK